jgi:hypothetical protein
MLLDMDNRAGVLEDVCLTLIYNFFLCELKNQGPLIIKCIPEDMHDANIFTKNGTSVVLNRHLQLYMGQDE